jgi:hypothetical protein
MKKLQIGKHYFIGDSRRVDQFAHKRFTTAELEKWEHIVVMGELIEQRENQIKLRLTGNGFEKDGKEYVFGTGSLLMAPGAAEARTLEDHGAPTTTLGVWK